MLDSLPEVSLKGYPIPTVIAEKCEALTTLGLANSRLKDFFDLLMISRLFNPKAEECMNAIIQTFKRRGTEIQKKPLALTEAFWEDTAIIARWEAFVRKNLTNQKIEVKDLLEELQEFLNPLLGWAAEKKTTAGNWNFTDRVWENNLLEITAPVPNTSLCSAIQKFDAEKMKALNRNAYPLEAAEELDLAIDRSVKPHRITFEEKSITTDSWGRKVRAVRKNNENR